MSKDVQKDEALFEALGKSKKKRRRKIIRTVVAIVLILAIVLTGAVIYLRQQVKEQFASNSVEVLSYEASTGTISTTVSGSGTLTDVDTEAISVPEGVEIVEVVVNRNHTVSQGDVLATVDMASVMSTLASVQDELDALDVEIADATGDTVSSYVKAGVSGRVKIIYAQAGESVVSVMAEHGALAVLSLDGYMAADIPTDALEEGDSVTVLRADGTTLAGTVDTALRGSATILVSDKNTDVDEEVTIVDGDGNEIATAQLYIHNPLNVTGYAGTISSVSTSVNATVYSSTSLFYLKDTSTSVNYDSLLRQRSEVEEELLELLALYRDGAVLAPFSGMVSSVDYTTGSTSVVTLCPNVQMSVTISVDESDILSLAVGQEAEVTVSSVSDETMVGYVTEISDTATTSSGVTYYSAVVIVDKVENMMNGMTASVEVRIEGVDDAILVPVEAVHQTSDIYYVYTQYDQETQTYSGMVEVTVGLSNSSYIEIVSGLQEGDTVYYTEEEETSFGFGNMNFGNMGDMGGIGGSSGEGGMGMPSDMGGMNGGDSGSRGDMGGFSGGR